MRRWMWQWIYNAVWYIVAAIWWLYHLIHAVPYRQKKQSLSERLALYPRFPKNGQVLWFHASSLGEVLTITPLMKKLRSHFQHTQVISMSTIRGREVAPAIGADHILYLPLDLRASVHKAIGKIRPDVLIVLETEIWPNLFWQCAISNIPVVVVSGRISPRSFRRYNLLPSFWSSILDHPIFLMQTQGDKDRIIAMGASPDRVEVYGNIKFDGIRSELPGEEIAWLTAAFPVDHPILVAGSTHPGEEEMLLQACRRLWVHWPNLTLIIAPRHLARVHEVGKLFKDNRLEYCLRSQLPCSSSTRVIIVDTYGELARIYWLADVVFVGGTLIPVGGHNLLEPAALGKPLIIGNYFSTCEQQVRLFQSISAIYIATSSEELAQSLEQLLANPEKASETGRKARELVLANQGSMTLCIDKIKKILSQASNAHGKRR